MVMYKGLVLSKGSQALFLYETWKKSGADADKKKLDQHMKDVETRYKELMK